MKRELGRSTTASMSVETGSVWKDNAQLTHYTARFISQVVLVREGFIDLSKMLQCFTNKKKLYII